MNQEIINAAIQKSVNGAVVEAIGGYSVREGISKAITEQVATGALFKAIALAAQKLDLESLTSSLAKEIEKAATKATVAFLMDGLTAAVCKLRGIGDYSPEDKIKRDAVKMELFS